MTEKVIEAAIDKPAPRLTEVVSQSHTGLPKPSFYKPELDILRFFAFLGVFVNHTAGYPLDFFLQHHVPLTAAKLAVGLVEAGNYCVDLFFVLSAYLITELLLREKEATGSLDVRAFYIRRILRIWPLYYLFVPLVVLLPFLDPPHQFGPRYFIPFLLFSGNWSFVFFGWPNSVALPLWSVSVEEQFYLIWPPIVKRLSPRKINIAVVVMICIANLTRLFAVTRHQSAGPLWGNTFAHLDSIAAGILLANFLCGRTVSLSGIKRIALFMFGALCLLSRGYLVQVDATEPITWLGTLIGYPAVVLGCAAILVAFVGSGFHSPPLEYLGKISYGLYVYHMLSLVLADKLLPLSPGVAHAALRLVVTLALTIAISALSYGFIEKPFLKLKRRFTYVDSRPA